MKFVRPLRVGDTIEYAPGKPANDHRLIIVSISSTGFEYTVDNKRATGWVRGVEVISVSYREAEDWAYPYVHIPKNLVGLIEFKRVR